MDNPGKDYYSYQLYDIGKILGSQKITIVKVALLPILEVSGIHILVIFMHWKVREIQPNLTKLRNSRLNIVLSLGQNVSLDIF